MGLGERARVGDTPRLALAHADTPLGKVLGPALERLGVEVVGLSNGATGPLDEVEVDRRMQELKVRGVGKSAQLDGFVYLLPGMAVDSIQDPHLDIRWQHGMDRLREAFYYYRRMAKLLASQRRGCILGVAFGIGARGDESMLTWSAVGEALAGLGQCLTREVMKQGVRVNTLYYGLVEEAEYPAEVREVLNKYTKLRDLPRSGRVMDLAAWIRLLISEEGSFVNAKVIQLDGGLLG